MKKTFEIKGVDLTELYGIGDRNILFLEKSLPLNINIRGNSLFCKGLKKDLDHFWRIKSVFDNLAICLSTRYNNLL